MNQNTIIQQRNTMRLKILTGPFFPFLACLLLSTPFLFFPGDARAATLTQTKSATTSSACVNDTSGAGTVSWTNASRATSSDDFKATVTVDGTVSEYLNCQTFGFTIPTGSTITAIDVTLERMSNSTGNGGSNDAAVRIVKNGVVSATSTDRATATVYGTTDSTEDHASSSDPLWGTTWTAADINANTFGAAVSVTKPLSAGAAHTVSIDQITITVTYTPPPVISGTLYSDEGTTAVTGGGKTLKLYVGTSSPGIFSTTTIAGTGFFQFTNLASYVSPGRPVSLWVDGDSSFRAVSFTKMGTAGDDITLPLYQNRISISHEDGAGTSTTNADLGAYDGDDDPDIMYKVSGTSLSSSAGEELHVTSGTTYAPGGTVTLHGNASTTIPDGDFHLAGVDWEKLKLVMGRDVKGDATGTGNQFVYSLTTSGTYLYVGKYGDATACNGTAGNAIGCELLVFDISTPSSPTLVAGRDVKGDATGIGVLDMRSLSTSGNYLYVGKGDDATACNGTAGNAIGCELLVFDISTPSSPTLVAGRDVKGDATGTGGLNIYTLTTSGNYLYVGKYGDATACNGTAGNAIGCELLVFDITTPSSPTLVAGRDVKGDSTGTGSVYIYSLTVSGNYLYVGKQGDFTACNGTAGNAIGCELLVFDISTPSSPTLVAGRDVDGSSTGTGNVSIWFLAISSNYLYVGKWNAATACNGTAGNAIGCELLVFDITTPSSPTIVAGRDVKGDATGTGDLFIYSLAVSGNYLYVGKSFDATACNGTAGNAIGCELLVFNISTPSSPTLVAGRDVKGDATGGGSDSVFSLTTSGNYLYVGKSADTPPL